MFCMVMERVLHCILTVCANNSSILTAMAKSKAKKRLKKKRLLALSPAGQGQTQKAAPLVTRMDYAASIAGLL